MAEMSSHAAESASRGTTSSLIYNLCGIAALVLLCTVGVAYLVDDLSRSARSPLPSLNDSEPVTQTLSGRTLTIPTKWFRYGEQVREGFTNQIDLRVLAFSDTKEARPVDITLLPRSRARTSASLLDAVYLHQFADDMLSGVPGLVGKAMRDSTGYAGESVWYDALSPNPFVAKCMERVEDDASPQCVRTVYLASGVAAVYVFDAALLQSWRQFDAEMERWLSPIGAW